MQPISVHLKLELSDLWPPRAIELDVDTQVALACLTSLWAQTLEKEILRRMTRNAVDLETAVREAKALVDIPYCVGILRSRQKADAVEVEAIALAEEEITRRLACDGLPPPRNLREHATQLIRADPSFLVTARTRCEARREVVHDLLGVQ